MLCNVMDQLKSDKISSDGSSNCMCYATIYLQAQHVADLIYKLQRVYYNSECVDSVKR